MINQLKEAVKEFKKKKNATFEVTCSDLEYITYLVEIKHLDKTYSQEFFKKGLEQFSQKDINDIIHETFISFFNDI